MSAVSLPMYDLPEIRPALDAWWAGLARHLAREGIADVPAVLPHGAPLDAAWSRPDLLLSQCCGYDLRNGRTGALRLLATPSYRAPGCVGPAYASVVIVAADAPAHSLDDLRGGVCAINAWTSHSGMNALRALIAPRSRGGRFFARIEVSGSHRCSLAMVARGEADVAAIDCVIHGLLARHSPGALAGTRPLGHTARAPAPPFVTAPATSDDMVERLRTALFRAFDDPSLEPARADLLLAAIEVLPPAAYARIRAFERLAARRGYPVLA
jgi:ABC-type phosphate/phosphonate transport system substrate-binding protein